MRITGPLHNRNKVQLPNKTHESILISKRFQLLLENIVFKFYAASVQIKNFVFLSLLMAKTQNLGFLEKN